MRLFRLLFDAAPVDGGDNTPAPTGAPPPAATVVVNSDAKEGDAAEMVKLKRECEEFERKATEAESAKKKLETDVAYLQDENRRLKTPPAPKDERSDMQRFLDGDS